MTHGDQQDSRLELQRRIGSNDAVAHRDLVESGEQKESIPAETLLSRGDLVSVRAGVRLLEEMGPDASDETRVQIAESLSRIAVQELDSELLSRVINLLGTCGWTPSVAVVLTHATDSDPEVRQSVAANVPFLVDTSNYGSVEDALLALSQDADDDVRDWATLGLGTQVLLTAAEQFFRTSTRTRNALYDRVTDSNPAVRGEALVGLARRGEPNVITLIEEELRGYSVSPSTIEAACIVADPQLVAALSSLASWWDEDKRCLSEAIDLCSSGGPHRDGLSER
jgi:HEAT repeat protein